MCTKRTLLGASKNRAWSLRLEKADFAVPYRGDEVGGSVLIEQASNGIYVELSIRLEAS